MALNTHEQISKHLESANHILVAFRREGAGDAIAGALALRDMLEKMDKKVDIISDDFEKPKTLEFLGGIDAIKPAFSFLQKFIISIDIKDIGVEELSYDVAHEKLRIFVTPKQGFLTGNHIRTAQSEFKYDLIFVVDTPDLESLGKVHAKHPELFYKVPVINIDHKSHNDHFGHVNLTDVTATSTCELIFKLIKDIAHEHIDEEMATTLLTGIIAKTRSFKTAETKPHTLSVASELIHLGAQRDLIIKNLYRTKTLNSLKLWGQALTHMHHDPENNFVWTTITRDDFARSGANEYDLHDIVDELISSSPQAKVILLIYEPNYNDPHPNIHALLTVENPYNAMRLLEGYAPMGDKFRASISLENKTLKDVENEIVAQVKKGIEENEM